MAAIVKTDYTSSMPDSIPVLYVDSMIERSFDVEMKSLMSKYIRTLSTTTTATNNTHDAKDVGSVTIGKYLAKDENDIRYNKNDGLWVVDDRTNTSLTLYRRKTNHGYLYNTVDVSKKIKLSFHKCKRVVPQILKKESLFDTFQNELASKVSEYKNKYINMSSADITL